MGNEPIHDVRMEHRHHPFTTHIGEGDASESIPELVQPLHQGFWFLHEDVITMPRWGFRFLPGDRDNELVVSRLTKFNGETTHVKIRDQVRLECSPVGQKKVECSNPEPATYLSRKKIIGLSVVPSHRTAKLPVQIKIEVEKVENEVEEGRFLFEKGWLKVRATIAPRPGLVRDESTH